MNRWSVSALWVATMIAAWSTVVPSVLSASSWGVATLAGPIFLVGASALWVAGRPEPSLRQSRASVEAAAAERGRR